MKNSNLLNRLLSYSHEKHSPQRLRRYAVMRLMLLTLGVGQMWASMGFENSNNGVKFTRTPLGGASGTWNESHGRTRDDVDLGNVTALTLKEWYCKFYQDEDNMCGEAEFYYRVYLKDGTPGGFTKVSKITSIGIVGLVVGVTPLRETIILILGAEQTYCQV